MDRDDLGEMGYFDDNGRLAGLGQFNMTEPPPLDLLTEEPARTPSVLDSKSFAAVQKIAAADSAMIREIKAKAAADVEAARRSAAKWPWIVGGVAATGIFGFIAWRLWRGRGR